MQGAVFYPHYCNICIFSIIHYLYSTGMINFVSLLAASHIGHDAAITKILTALMLHHY